MDEDVTPESDKESLEPNLYLINRIIQENRNNPELQKYREKAHQGCKDWTIENGLIKYQKKLIVPPEENLHTYLLNEIHCQISTAHPGSKKTWKLVYSRYYWPKMRENIDRYIVNCGLCRRSRKSRDLSLDLLNPLPIPQRSW